MKNINEQIDRIKQLFTEERLHGNLVENDSDELLSEASGVNIGYKTINNYLNNKVYTDGDKSVFLNKFATPKYFEKIKKLKEKRSKRSIGQVAIKTKEYDEATNFFMVAADEGSKQSEFTSALIKYIKKEGFENLNTDNFSKMLKAHKTVKHSNGRIYKIFEVKGLEKPEKYQLDKEATPTDKEDNTDANKEMASDVKKGRNTNRFGANLPKTKDLPSGVDVGVGMGAIGNKKDGESQVATGKNEPKSEPDTKVKKGATKTGDFTKALQKLGGSQKGYTYHLIEPKKAVKKDASGKVVATYIKESNFNKKSLFESAYTFDINNSLTENWKWVEGKGGQGQTFSDNLSKKFDDAIAQIGGETSVTDTVDPKVSAAKGDGEDEGKIPKGWDKFPCVYNNPDKVEKKRDDGTTHFVIGNVMYFNNGRCEDTKTKEKRNYKCNGDDINIEDTKKSVEKPIDTTEKEIAFKWTSGSPGKLKVVGNHLDNLGGIKRLLDGMVDSLDGTVSEDDVKDLLKNINLIKDIKLKKRMDYHGVAQKASAPNYCKGSCGKYFFPQIPENEEGSLLSALLKAYEKDESGDTVSGDIKEILDDSSYFMKNNTEERRKILQDILNIVKNY